MNHSDIRKYLKQGEQAVDVLKSLGYTYVANGKEHPHWVAPVNPLDPILEGIKKLAADYSAEKIKEETSKAFLLGEASGKREVELKGPNWDNVKDLVGQVFCVSVSKIPGHSKLITYGANHFNGKQFKCLEIRYHRSIEYTGYAVIFEFNSRPFTSETVWLPLGSCVFRKEVASVNF